jgi:2-haloacid dehalogenase
LKDQGFRLATLTNFHSNALKQITQFKFDRRLLEQALSIDGLKKIKPEEGPIYGQLKLQVKPEEMMLIAAHGWEGAGASAAGLQTAHSA